MISGWGDDEWVGHTMSGWGIRSVGGAYDQWVVHMISGWGYEWVGHMISGKHTHVSRIHTYQKNSLLSLLQILL